jgi:hypothetical protein
LSSDGARQPRAGRPADRASARSRGANELQLAKVKGPNHRDNSTWARGAEGGAPARRATYRATKLSEPQRTEGPESWPKQAPAIGAPLVSSLSHPGGRTEGSRPFTCAEWDGQSHGGPTSNRTGAGRFPIWYSGRVKRPTPWRRRRSTRCRRAVLHRSEGRMRRDYVKPVQPSRLRSHGRRRP